MVSWKSEQEWLQQLPFDTTWHSKLWSQITFTLDSDIAWDLISLPFLHLHKDKASGQSSLENCFLLAVPLVFIPVDGICQCLFLPALFLIQDTVTLHTAASWSLTGIFLLYRTWERESLLKRVFFSMEVGFNKFTSGILALCPMLTVLGLGPDRNASVSCSSSQPGDPPWPQVGENWSLHCVICLAEKSPPSPGGSSSVSLSFWQMKRPLCSLMCIRKLLAWICLCAQGNLKSDIPVSWKMAEVIPKNGRDLRSWNTTALIYAFWLKD